MNKTVFTKLGFVRTALAAGVGIPLFLASSAFAQNPAPSATPLPAQVPDAPISTSVAAQQQDTTATGGAPSAERIIVTGSYIPTAETESALPVTVYTAETLTKQGAQTPAEGLRQLPSFVGNTATENDSNGGDGTALINLRALGAGNTLTLLNGRRAFSFADINLIGIGALSRTEILKDGASSVYGADAVAGVVNFILLDGPNEAPYEGGEIFALYGNTTDTDAHVRQFYGKGGVTGLDGKFAVAASVEYYSRANLLSQDREIARTGDLSNDATGLQLGGQNTNSPTFGGRVAVLLDPVTGQPSATGNRTQLVLKDLTNATPAGIGDYRQFDVVPGTDVSRFNFRSVTPAIPAQERFDYYAAASYKVFGEGLQIYGNVFYSHLTQDNGLAGAPFLIASFTGSTAFPNGDLPIFQASPFNPFGANLQQLRYRLQNDLGNRRSFFEKDAYHYTAGIKGDFNMKDNAFISHFGYDSGFVYDRFDEGETDSGDATESGIDFATQGTDSGGNPAPFFNPFIGINAPISGVAPTFVNGVPTGQTLAYDNGAAAQSASFIARSFFLTRSYLVDAKFNAHLFPNLYNGGIDIAGGYEHRQERVQSIADATQAKNDQLGFNGGADFKFTTEVDSVFGELSVPVVTSTMNIPGVRSFEISLAYRYEKFDESDNDKKRGANFDNANPNEDFGGSPRVAIRYQPIEDVTLRATASQSFLAPSASQLFSPVIQNFPVINDPVIGTTVQPPLGVFQGGNTGLKPEKTDSYTAGVVYSPSFARGLTLTADYYQLFTTDLVIGAAAFSQVLVGNGVIDPDGPGGGSPLFGGGPALGVTRDGPGNTGNILAIDSAAGNAGRRNVQGLDMSVVYQLPTQNLGTFTVSGGLNHFFTYKVEALPRIAGGTGFTNFLGNFNSSLPLTPGAVPFNKAFLRGEWEFKGFDFVATGNYIGDYEDDPNFILGNDLVVGNPGTDANPNFQLHRRVTSYITLDMRLAYTFPKPVPVEAAPEAGYSKDAKDGKGMVQQTASVSTADTSANIFQRLLWDTTLAVGVNNAFDRQPPTVLGAFNDNYDTSLYSIRNRYYYISLTKKF